MSIPSFGTERREIGERRGLYAARVTYLFMDVPNLSTGLSIMQIFL